MTVRPPRPRPDAVPPHAPVVLLKQEFAQKKASALGRLGRALERALAALNHFDATIPETHSDSQARNARRKLVAEAGHALWLFIVQREACGLRDARQVVRDYGVPAEVYVRMGVGLPSPAPMRRLRKYR